MIFTQLEEKEFEEFVNKHKCHNFFQTIMMKKRQDLDGIENYLVGVKEDNKVIAASLITYSGITFMGKKSYEAYKGFILDYDNKELLTFMTNETIKFLKEKNALKLTIDPYIVNISRDMDGNIIEGEDNRYIKDYLKELGFIENKKGSQVKWCYCLDINNQTSDELYNSFRSSTRNNINKTVNKYMLDIRDLTKEELPEFKKITLDTSKRRGFGDRSLDYYEKMYDTFKDDVVFKICQIDLDKYKNNLVKENEELNNKIINLSDSSSNAKKKEQFKIDIQNNEKRIEEADNLIKQHGNIIPLSGAMFILYGDEIIYLFSGSYDEYMKFYGQYRLQWEIIKYAADHKYRRYNFYGIGDPKEQANNDYGVYEFKKGFGGYVEELLGSFDISISPINKIYNILKKVKRIIKK